MGFYSLWPALVDMGLLVLLASTPLFRLADSVPAAHARKRIVSLDGLRGFLALAVFFHHAAVYHQFLLGVPWGAPESHVYFMLGRIGIMMFFMITGYLFWSRLIRSEGRPDWLSLYIGRIFRIGPLYLFAFLLVVVFALLQTGPHLQVAPKVLLGQLVAGSSLGMLPMRDVNGVYGSQLLLDGVTWTLRIEWGFYIGLFVLALFTMRRRLHLLFAAGALLCFSAMRLLHTPHAYALWLATVFLCGMLSASLQAERMVLLIPDKAASVAILLLLPVPFYWNNRAGDPALLPLALVFFLVVSGCTFFGLLSSRPARRLGDISYGIYLLQGVPQALVFRPTGLRRFALQSPLHHWILTLIAAVLLILLAEATHALIEQPGIRWGRRLLAVLRPTHASNSSKHTAVS